MKAVSVKNLTKIYKNQSKPAIDDLSFDIEEGSIVGLIGANGAGKSTLIKCLLNLLTYSSGSIIIRGVDSRDFRCRNGVVYVPESPRLDDVLTPLEIIKNSQKLHNVRYDQVNAIEWLDKFGVGHVATKKVKSFSKGMTQRTALAAGFACNPEFLILDEPLSGLDPVGRKEVVDILAEYKSTGGTLLFTSHVLHDVERLADEYCVISNGRLVEFKSAEALRNASSYVVKTLSGNSFSEQSVPQEELWQVLDFLRQNDQKIVSVTPELNLEKLFFGSIES